MRTISKKTKYALQALLALSRRYGEGPVSIAMLSKEEDIPIKFLETILLDLKNIGLLESRKGPGGGYLLRRAPEKVTIGSVVRKIEGPLAPLACASYTAYRRCQECRDVEHCGTRMVMRDVRNAISEVLDKTTLRDVIERVEASKGGREEPLMYYI